MSPLQSEARASTVDSPLADQEDEPPLPRVEGSEHSTGPILKFLSQTVTSRACTESQNARSANDLVDDATRRQHSERVKTFRKLHFPGVSTREWNDWHWQAKNRIRLVEQLERYLRLVPEEREAFRGNGTSLPVAITPYYLALLDPQDGRQGLRRSVIPSVNEFVRMPGEADDPLAEDSQAVVPGLIHR